LFGISYNGYLADSNCYSAIGYALEAMHKMTSCMLPDHRGRCKILYPYQNDSQSYYCTGTYGVAYNGYSANGACYSSIDKAMAAMMSNPACN